jgi:murein DD-endopeptidase MepM/ murein hydrolase activator NlpD
MCFILSNTNLQHYLAAAFVGSLLAIFQSACQQQKVPADNSTPELARIIPIADHFAYPVGSDTILTQAKDSKDDWFNALDFGEDTHLGEDWNKNSGGNTECGEPVYASADGVITYAADAGPGWGNVVIITHTLPNRFKVQTLYGHLQEIAKTSGEVGIREQIGKVGNANGKYLCHLHFELREESSPIWNKAGPGYAADRSGSLDPSDFVDKRIKE